MFPPALISWDYGSVATEAHRMSINPFRPGNTIDRKSMHAVQVAAVHSPGAGKGLCLLFQIHLTTERAKNRRWFRSRGRYAFFPIAGPNGAGLFELAAGGGSLKGAETRRREQGFKDHL